jgi:hypothetical protein
MLAGIGALSALAVVERQGGDLQARFANRRDIVADIARFRETAPKLADVDALLKDRRALTLVLEAFQLESEIDKRAILRRVLTENPSGEGSLVNRLADPRWKQLALAFDTGSSGGPPFALASTVNVVIEGALTNRFEKEMGEANQGMREALYFRRMAGQVISVGQLMADRALTEVARGALGLPKQFGLLSFEQQRDLLTRRLDLEQFKDPKAVARLAQRYLAQLEPVEAAASQVTALFGGGDPNLIAALGSQRVSFSI